MKKLLLLITSICLWQISFSQTVPLDSVQFYAGKEIKVCSKVMDTYVSKTNEGTTFLNFGKPYPYSTFTAVIFEKNLVNFKYNPSIFLKDKNICITGKVIIYKDKPEIIVSKEEQIKIE